MLETLELKKDYLSIGEVSAATQIPPYVLRYWEREFQVLHPARRDSGHRKYSHKDVENILQVKELLRSEGFTIRGAKKYLAHERRKNQGQIKSELGENGAAFELLKETGKTIDEILKILNKN